jgi:hypothetical protein
MSLTTCGESRSVNGFLVTAFSCQPRDRRHDFFTLGVGCMLAISARVCLLDFAVRSEFGKY